MTSQTRNFSIPASLKKHSHTTGGYVKMAKQRKKDFFIFLQRKFTLMKNDVFCPKIDQKTKVFTSSNVKKQNKHIFVKKHRFWFLNIPPG